MRCARWAVLVVVLALIAAAATPVEASSHGTPTRAAPGAPAGRGTLGDSGDGSDVRRAAVDAPEQPASSASPDRSGRAGYWMLELDGDVHEFGDAVPVASVYRYGSPVSVATDLGGTAAWVVDRRGALHSGSRRGDLFFPERVILAEGEAVTAIAVRPYGDGYWFFTSRGRVFAFGAARHLGDMAGVALNGGIIAAAATPSGDGYWMVGSDGGIFTFGDARFAGSMGGRHLNAAVVGIAPDADGAGYWLVASDGGIFAFDAGFRGSIPGVLAPGQRLNAPVIGAIAYGEGYLMVASDGGIFSFSDQEFLGSLGADPPNSAVVAVAAFATGVPGVVAPAPDPLGIIVDDLHLPTLGTDRVAVWVCSSGAPTTSPAELAAWAQANVAPYFASLSGGRFALSFVGAGAIGSSVADGRCVADAVAATRSPYTSAVVFVGESDHTVAVTDVTTIRYPGEPPASAERSTTIRGRSAGIWIHEVGHQLGWPHSFTGPDEYDNLVDVMSAPSIGSPNCPRVVGSLITTSGCPAQGTLAINRYAAGWIDPAAVTVHGGGTTSVVLVGANEPGQQLVVVRGTDPLAALTVDARPALGPDVVLAEHGVTVHTIDQRSAVCGDATCTDVLRRQRPVAGIGYPWRDHLIGPPAIGPEHTAHVLAPGESLSYGGITVAVGASTGNGYQVTVTGPATAAIP